MKLQSRERILSIDALRGFDMFWIIGGDSLFRALPELWDGPLTRELARQVQHVEWNGFTFYDLVFPLFLFIVGLTLPFAITRRLQRGTSRSDLYRHVVKRALTLFALGLVYSQILDFDFSDFRYTGVLQRISICYFAGALIVLNTKIRTQAIIVVGILVGYFAILKLVPVPGFGAGVLTPEGNLSAFIDQALLPGRFCCFQYGDNEGILSTIPALATTLIGVLTGHWLSVSPSRAKSVRGLLAAGVAALATGLLWGLVFPINKILWTSSYVLYAAGWSLLLLALFYWVIDVRGYKKWAFPLVVIGMNPITIYVLQSVFDFGIIANIVVHGFIGSLGAFQPVFFILCVLGVKWLFLYFLYRQRIFLKA